MEGKAVLKSYLSQNGNLNYDKIKDEDWFNELVDYIENAKIKDMSHLEEFAFWLNAYNFITIKSVCKKLEKNPHWEGVTSLFRRIKFFYLERHQVAGRKISLYSLENKILRKKFNDPRIHFALNCASKSCPFLPSKIFRAEELDDYLDQLTFDFINNQGGAIIKNQDTIQVSRIFKWYEEDFDQENGVYEFIKKYWKDETLPKNPRIEYQDYNWSVNKK